MNPMQKALAEQKAIAEQGAPPDEGAEAINLSKPSVAAGTAVFKSSFSTLGFVMPSGEQFAFGNGMFITNNEAIVKELRAAIRSGNRHIWEVVE